MDDVYTIKTTALPSSARVVSFRGIEAIGKPYRFELSVQLHADDARGLDLMDVVGKKATLAMHTDRSEGMTFHGILSTVELLHAHASFALFRAVLEPRLVRLKHSLHSRMFTSKSIPDILKAVLEENGLSTGDYELQLVGQYSPEEHVCQYHETDFDFISRWMEHLGMYYFFEHAGDHDKLVITDDKSSQTDVPTGPVRYFPSMAADRSADAAMETFRCKASSLPASVKLKDYDYVKPTLDVSGSAKVAANGVGEISIYGARIFSPSDATAFAKLRAQEMLARQLEHTGSSTVLLRAGYQFTLEEHPIDAFNIKYLATEVEHFGNLVGQSADLASRIEIPYPDVYRCNVTAIPAKVQFRPIRATAWPRIYGFEHGVIDGATDSQYAQIDDHGRYQVKFAFDESDLQDGKASTWVRMMQPHGGGIEGFHFPLRKGTEVVFCFMGGDPDRPVIAGVVNNTTTPSPITSGNNTRNVIQTGGRNRIEIEDQEGQERVSISSPHKNSYIRFGAPNDEAEMHLNTDGSGIVHTQKNLTVNVDTNLTEHIIGTTDQTYHAAQTIHSDATRDDTVGHEVNETYGGKQTTKANAGRELQVTGDFTESATGKHSLTTGARTDQVNGTLDQTATGAITIKAPTLTNKISGQVMTTAAGIDVTNGGAHTTITLGATLAFAASATATISAAATASVTVGASMSAFAGVQISGVAALTAAFAAGKNLRAATSITQASTNHNIDTGTLDILAAMVDITSAEAKINGVLIKLA